MKAHIAIDYHDMKGVWLIRCTVHTSKNAYFGSEGIYCAHPKNFKKSEIKKAFKFLKDKLKKDYKRVLRPSLIGCKYEWVVDL